MKWFNFILRLGLGGFFIYAGVEKIIDPAGFAKSIGNYKMLPLDGVNLLAITLPWIEVLGGGLLAIGVWRRGNALLIAGLLIVFIVAVGSAMHRGLNIECGCTGTVGGQKVGFTKIFENLGLLAVAGWLIWKEKE
ncbi:MAG: MauE/DoxX family redox-associated membrane protein [Verrucomicrobiota bacterium]